MTYETISLRLEDSAGVVQLNRPEKHNALSSKLLKELSAALTELENNARVSGVILTGSEHAFSTGADLNEAVAFTTATEAMSYNRLFRDVTYKMESLYKPVVAAISGYCITGGLELALASDIRYAANNAKFSITSAKIGSVAGAGGTQRLPRIVGKSIAMELLFTSRFFDAAYAEHIGLVNKVVPEGEVLQAAVDLVGEFATQGPLSLTWMKMAVHTGMDLDRESGLVLESVLNSNAFRSADKAEGMRAFLEKRPPVFRGE